MQIYITLVHPRSIFSYIYACIYIHIHISNCSQSISCSATFIYMRVYIHAMGLYTHQYACLYNNPFNPKNKHACTYMFFICKYVLAYIKYMCIYVYMICIYVHVYAKKESPEDPELTQPAAGACAKPNLLENQISQRSGISIWLQEASAAVCQPLLATTTRGPANIVWYVRS